MRLQSLVKICGRTATGDEKQLFVSLFVCSYVCIFCHAGCPRKKSGHSATHNVTACRSISMPLPLFFKQRNALSNCLRKFQLHVSVCYKLAVRFLRRTLISFILCYCVYTSLTVRRSWTRSGFESAGGSERFCTPHFTTP